MFIFRLIELNHKVPEELLRLARFGGGGVVLLRRFWTIVKPRMAREEVEVGGARQRRENLKDLLENGWTSLRVDAYRRTCGG